MLGKSGNGEGEGGAISDIEGDRGGATPEVEESVRHSGLLYKWTNYRSGYRPRWFVLEDGVLSYYKSAGDCPNFCRGSIHVLNSKVYTNPQDKQKIDVVSTSKAQNLQFHLKAESAEEVNAWILMLYQSKNIELNKARDSHFINDQPFSPDLEINAGQKLIDNQIYPSSDDSTAGSGGNRDGEDIIGSFHVFQEKYTEIKSILETMLSGSPHGQDVRVMAKEAKRILGYMKIREDLWHRQYNRDQKKIEAIDRVMKQCEMQSRLEDTLVGEREKYAAFVRMVSGIVKEYEETKNVSRMIKKLNACVDAEEQSDVEEEDEDVFFDAVDSLSVVALNSGKQQQKREDKKMKFLGRALEGYPEVRRKRLPSSSVVSASDVSIWSILKSAVGKDLTRMGIPIQFSEPVSMLQRMAEELEYSELINKACEIPESLIRLQYVAAFIVSGYSSSDKRLSKPTNPVLHETFEYVNKDGGYRYIAEQVSHHPPMSVCYCEGWDWTFLENVQVKTNFWGKSLEIIPLGVSRLFFKNTRDEYVWKKVTTAIHNIIIGKMWIDHYGTMTIKNRRTGEKCVLTFKQANWLGTGLRHVNGCVMDSEGRTIYEMRGKWNEYISSTLVDASRSLPSKINLWRTKPRPPYSATMYNFTYFAMTLNEISAELSKRLCPTDSRFRPDQRALENGDLSSAIKSKTQLEDEQRKIRKKNIEKAQKWGSTTSAGDSDLDLTYLKPKWFEKVDKQTDDIGIGWAYKGGYWEQRESGRWEEKPLINLRRATNT